MRRIVLLSLFMSLVAAACAPSVPEGPLPDPPATDHL